MGLYDIIKKHGRFERKKEQVVAKTKEEFQDFCKSLTKEFRGMMCLYGRIDGRLYTAGVLLEGGDITAASFEDVADEKISLGEEAIFQIKERLSGTTGDLKVYALSDESMRRVKEENKRALLKYNIPFSYLGMEIKSRNMKTEADNSHFIGGEKIEELKTGEGFNLVDFAHKFPFTPRIHEGETLEGKIGVGPDLKKERLTELKRKRRREDLTLAKRISRVGRRNEGRVKDASKVETSIDRLYQLVQRYEKVRINDKLARKLDVNRSQIENWAVILEEHDLVELHYPAIGEPEIRKIKEKK